MVYIARLSDTIMKIKEGNFIKNMKILNLIYNTRLIIE